jgi:hypothetical protein
MNVREAVVDDVGAAAAGQGEDAAKVSAADRLALCWQALTWLRADLALRRKQLEGGKPSDRAEVRRAMNHWQQAPALAGLRDTAAQAKLPAEECAACVRLWADIATLLKQAEAKPN